MYTLGTEPVTFRADGLTFGCRQPGETQTT